MFSKPRDPKEYQPQRVPIREVSRRECRSRTCDIKGVHPSHSRCDLMTCMDRGIAHMTPHRI